MEKVAKRRKLKPLEKNDHNTVNLRNENANYFY